MSGRPIAIGRFDPRQYTNQLAIVALPGGVAGLFEATSTYSSFMFYAPRFRTPSGTYEQYNINCVAVGKVDGRRPSQDVVLFADDWSAYEAYWDSSTERWITELIYTDWDAWNAFDTPAFRQIAIGDFDSAHTGLEAVTAGGMSGHIMEFYYSGGWQSRRLADLTDSTGDGAPIESVAVGDFDPSNTGEEIVASRQYPYQAIEVYGSGGTWNTRVIVNMWDVYDWGGEHVYSAAVGDVDPNRPGNELYLGTWQLIEAWWNGAGFSYQVLGPSVPKNAVVAVAVGDFDPRYSGPEIVAGEADGLVNEFYYSGGWQSSLMTNVGPNLKRAGILVASLDPSIPGVQVIAASSYLHASVRVIALSGPSMQRFKLTYEVIAIRDAIKSLMKKSIEDYASLVVELNNIGSPIFGPDSAAPNWPQDLTQDLMSSILDAIASNSVLQYELEQAMMKLMSGAQSSEVASQLLDKVAQYSGEVAKIKHDARVGAVVTVLFLAVSIAVKALFDNLYHQMDTTLGNMMKEDSKLMNLYGNLKGVTDRNEAIGKISSAFELNTLYSTLDSDANDVISYLNSAALPSNVDYLVGVLQDFASQLLDIAAGRRGILIYPDNSLVGKTGQIVLANLNSYYDQVKYYAGFAKLGKTIQTYVGYVGIGLDYVSTAVNALLIFQPAAGASGAVAKALPYLGLASALAGLVTTFGLVIESTSDVQMYLLFMSASFQLACFYMLLVPELLGPRVLQYIQYYLVSDCPDSQASIGEIWYDRVPQDRSQPDLGATDAVIHVTIQNVQSGGLLLYSLKPAGTSQIVDHALGSVSNGVTSFRSPISFSWIRGSYDGWFELWVGARRADVKFVPFDTGVFSSSLSLASGALRPSDIASASLSASGASDATVQLLYSGSQVDLHVYDSQNRHLGINYVSGSMENLIPGATYGSESDSPTWASLPSGTYSISAIGVSTTTGGLSVPGATEPFSIHGSIDAMNPGLLSVFPTRIEIVRETRSSFWFDVQVQERTGQNGLSACASWMSNLAGPSGFLVAPTTWQDPVSDLDPGGQSYVRVWFDFPYNAPPGVYTGVLSVFATGAGGSNPRYTAEIPVSVQVTSVGTRTGVSQPYILGFKVSNAYSDSHVGDFAISTTGWSSSDASFQVTLAQDESLFLIGTAQVWNDYANVGSSIAITRNGVRVSGDMFAAGATIASRELAVAIAVDTPGPADTYTYALSAKTDPGGRAWVSQPYILGFKVSDVHSQSVTGDFSYSTTSWSASPASFTVNLGAGDSFFLIGTAQVWNDNPTGGSSIAITRGGTRVSGDMFAAGATITSRELAVAIAVDNPGADGDYTYALSAKTDSGGQAWISQPYILGFKVSNVYSSLLEGDHYVTTKSWSSSGASLQASVGSGESLFLIGTAQLWNEYSTIGSSIAVCMDDGVTLARVSGDMFAAGAMISKRELAVAIAVSSPGAGTWTYSLSAKTD